MPHLPRSLLLAVCALLAWSPARADVGVGAKPLPGAEMLFDGTREMLDAKWTYWEGPRFASSLPIKWRIVEDPVDKGTALMVQAEQAATDLEIAKSSRLTASQRKTLLELLQKIYL